MIEATARLTVTLPEIEGHNRWEVWEREFTFPAPPIRYDWVNLWQRTATQKGESAFIRSRTWALDGTLSLGLQDINADGRIPPSLRDESGDGGRKVNDVDDYAGLAEKLRSAGWTLLRRAAQKKYTDIVTAEAID